jgi:hypothetical protein
VGSLLDEEVLYEEKGALAGVRCIEDGKRIVANEKMETRRWRRMRERK